MKKIFEDFFDLFFPGTDKEGEEDSLWLKILVFILMAGCSYWLFNLKLGFLS